MLKAKQKVRFVRRERAQSVLEVAISLPVIILLLVGTLNFGMGIFSYIILRDAAQEGALYASFDPGNKAAIERRARSINPESAGSPEYSPIDLSDTELVKVTINIIGKDCQGFSEKGPNSVEVNVSYNYPLYVPFAGPIFGSNTIPLSASATNVILQPPCR